MNFHNDIRLKYDTLTPKASWAIFFSFLFFFGGGGEQLGQVSARKNLRKKFEAFILKIAENAPNF